MNAPQPGSYIRPVGRGYAYCYQVVKVISHDGGEQWHAKRFGLDDNRQPVMDGHQGTHYLDNLRRIAPGVWKDEWSADTPRWSCCPLYYRQMHVGAQADLFA